MRLFRLRFILLGLLLCVFHVWCRTCGSDFSDPLSSAYLANIVLEGTVSQRFPGDVRHNVSVAIKKVYKGEELLKNNERRKRVKFVIIGEFGEEDKANCIANIEMDSKYLFFLRSPKSSSVTQPTGSSFHFHISAFPVRNKKKTFKSVRRFLSKKAAAPKIRKMKYVEQEWGKRAQLVCRASSKLAVQYTWTKDSKVVKRGVKTGRKQSRLRINKLSARHAGTYRCKASNAAGHVQETATITVIRYSNCSERDKFYCLNEGVCRWYKELGRKSCRCPPEFEGERCQTRAIPIDVGADLERLQKLEKDRTLIIIGIITGVLVFIAICIVSFFLAQRRRKQYYRKLEVKKLHEENNIPQNTYQALNNDEVDGTPPCPTTQLSCASLETQTDSAELICCNRKMNGLQALKSSAKHNSRARLAASSGNEEQKQLRPRSTEGRFLTDMTSLSAPPPYSEVLRDYNKIKEPTGIKENMDSFRTDNPYIPTINTVAPSSHLCQEQSTCTNDSNCEKGSFRSPVIDIASESDSDSNSDSDSSEKTPSLHISEVEISDQGESRGNTELDGQAFSISQADSFNQNSEHDIHNNDSCPYGSDSGSSSTTPISSHSVKRAAPPNGSVKRNWGERSSPVSFYDSDDASYQVYPILSQSDPALSRVRENGEPLYRAHLNDEQHPIMS